MSRLNLPSVTLVCIDNRTPALAEAALRRCMAQIDFARVLLFTDPQWRTPQASGIEVLAVAIDSVPAYSQFMLRGLDAHVQTDHVLVVQWDGYVLDATQWDPGFLDWDYLGAPLRDAAVDRAVGNGGFSLRSKRLLRALQDPEMVLHHPEDICICHTNRDRLERQHDIRIAPLPVAQRFAYERTAPNGPTFGFHGLFNLPQVMPAPELQALLRSLPDSMARGLDAHDLCVSLMKQGQLQSADLILAMRKRLGMTDRRTWRLRWRRWLAGWNQP